MTEAERERSIFARALEAVTPQEREEFLRECCAEAPALLERVRALLRASEAPAAFLPGTPGGLPRESDVPRVESPSDRVGRYQLLEGIGEGGFSVLFLAEQVEPVRRRAALKVIKPVNGVLILV